MLIRVSALISTSMDLFMRRLALKRLSKTVWLSGRTVISLRLPELYYMESMCRPNTGPMRYLPLSTFLIDFPQKSCSFKLHSRPWLPMSSCPRPSCSLPGYLGTWLMCTFTRTSEPNWTRVLFGVFSWAMPCIRWATAAMIPLPVSSM